MPKIVIWTFALCAVLLPFGRASAKARRDKPLQATSAASAETTAAPETPKAEARRERPKAKANEEAKPKGKLAKQARREPKVKPPCFSPEVHIARRRGDQLEHRDLSLTFCDGTPNPAALDSISVLGRARDVERPLMPEIRAYQRRPTDRGPLMRRRRPDYLSEHVMRVHADLLPRLQKVAKRFPGKTIEIVSGHRPDARDTSRHHHGRALDIRVDGVSREALRDFLRTLDQTGVGYYPNSYFVHMDVREDRGYWVDRSGPGEAADYGTWPPTQRDVERSTERVVARAMRDLAALGEGVTLDKPRAETKPVESHDEPSEDELTREEVEKIRAEALSVIEAL